MECELAIDVEALTERREKDAREGSRFAGVRQGGHASRRGRRAVPYLIQVTNQLIAGRLKGLVDVHVLFPVRVRLPSAAWQCQCAARWHATRKHMCVCGARAPASRPA